MRSIKEIEIPKTEVKDAELKLAQQLIAQQTSDTFDPSACLSVPTALDFMASLVDGGWPEVMRRNHELALRARDLLCGRLGIDPPAPDDMLGSMAAVPLTEGKPYIPTLYGDPLQDALFYEHNIEVPIHPWPYQPKRVLRVSAQLYNEISDYEKLANALDELLPKF